MRRATAHRVLGRRLETRVCHMNCHGVVLPRPFWRNFPCFAVLQFECFVTVRFGTRTASSSPMALIPSTWLAMPRG